MIRSHTRLVRLVTASAFVLASGLSLQARAELLFSDNFNVADTTDFDAASLAGRLGGSLSGTIKLQSTRQQHEISGNQLSIQSAGTGSGRLVFQTQAATSTRYDWAAGTEAADILSAGGVSIEFDWTRSGNNGNWLSFNTGFTYGSTEPSLRVNDSGTDYGILFQNNGGTQRFNNGGAPSAISSFTATNDPQHVTIDLLFDSYANGETVSVITTVGTTVVDNSSFNWAGNSGAFFFELGAFNDDNMKIDNLSVSTVPEPGSLALLGLGGLLIARRRRNA